VSRPAGGLAAPAQGRARAAAQGATARQLAALVRKDLLLELRGREVLLGMVTFVLCAFVLFRFALGGQHIGGGVRASLGLLWISIAFTAVLGLSRTFAAEREHGVWDGLLSAPVDRAVIWAAKACSLVAFLAAMELVALPAFWLFFLQGGGAPSLLVLAAAALLVDVGIAALGALLAGLAAATSAREVLLPVLFLPFAIPLVLGAVQVSIDSIHLQSDGFATLRGLGFLCLYDTIFALLGWALFEYVVEE
jgi:heme exporter protein B